MHCVSLAFVSIIFIGGIVGWRAYGVIPTNDKEEVPRWSAIAYHRTIDRCCDNEHYSQAKELLPSALNNSISRRRLHEVLDICLNSTTHRGAGSWCSYIERILLIQKLGYYQLIGRKPVIRLRSINNRIISDVNVSLKLDSHLWRFSSLYPMPSITDGKYFAQWNHLSVDPNGTIVFEHNRNDSPLPDRVYPLINDENKYRMLFWEALVISSTNQLWQKGHLCVPRHNFSRILNYLLKKMTFSSEDRDSLITFVLPQLDEVDPTYSKEKVRFHFLSPDLYSKSAQLTIDPTPQYLVRAFLVFELANNDYPLATMDQLENELTKVTSTDTGSKSGLIVYEWGSMFIH